MYDDTLEIMESVRLTETGFTVRYHVVKNDLDDGHEDGAWEYGSGFTYTPGYATYDDAIDAAFTPGWNGGYPVLYVGDGEILCRACAIETFKDSGEYITPWLEQDMQQSGEHCGGCSEEIYPPFCGDCGTDLDGENGPAREPWAFSDGGEHLRCGECLKGYRRNALTLKAEGPKMFAKYAYYVPAHKTTGQYAYDKPASYEVWEYYPQTVRPTVWISGRGNVRNGPEYDIPFRAVDTFTLPENYLPFDPGTE